MRNYEVVYIFHPALEEEAINTRLERFHGILSGSEGAEISEVDHWGIRQLAYEVGDQNQGYYVVTQFVASPADVAEFERIVKLDEELLRYLVVLSEGEPTSGMSIVEDVPVSEDDEDREDAKDDDDDDDEDEDEDGEDDDEESPPEFSGGRGKRRRVEGPRIELLNYKDVSTLSRFVTEQGKILPRRTTKVTARFQRQLGSAVKRARFLALLPYLQKHDR
ncbi:MAG: 30S ribosomal protein S6 [Gemmatimonadales bacterium]|nr:MAG: 30S ribosomal protein S6 [Gemmatimonadales bacterium]